MHLYKILVIHVMRLLNYNVSLQLYSIWVTINYDYRLLLEFFQLLDKCSS